MMSGEPDQINAQPLQPDRLVENLGIKILIVDAGIRWIAEIIDDPNTQMRFHGFASPLISQRPLASKARAVPGYSDSLDQNSPEPLRTAPRMIAGLC